MTAAPSTAEQSATWDRTLAKLGLIRQFLQIYHVAADPELRTQLEKQMERFRAALSLDSGEATYRAQLYLREMQEGVYPDDLAQAVHGNGAHIEIDPPAPMVNDVVRFAVRFDDPRLNNAAARTEFDLRWNFGHDHYGEIGWEPFHYFPQGGSFPVCFEFQSAGDKQPLTVKRDVTIAAVNQRWYQRDRNRAELGRFLITLMPAMFGLLSGAREQLLKMDMASAVFTIFMLGFSSDTVKNLVSQTQQTSSTSMLPKTAGSTDGTAPSPTRPASATATVAVATPQ